VQEFHIYHMRNRPYVFYRMSVVLEIVGPLQQNIHKAFQIIEFHIKACFTVHIIHLKL
jgi:hypothetical protein